MGLTRALQELREQGKQVELGWRRRCKGGGRGKELPPRCRRNSVARHWYGLKANERDQLASELQKIYISEIHVTIRTGGKKILVALGTEFTDSFMSKYDVERLGGTFTDEMAQITE